MKKTLALAALLAVGLTSAFAQQAGPASQGQVGAVSGQHGKHGDRAARQAKMKEILKQLNLTADQQKRVDDLEKSHGDKVKEARKASKGDKKAWQEKAKSLRKEHDDAFDAILTKDQQKQFKKLRKEAMKEFRKNGGDNKTP